jgi:hypothetical protein
VQPKRQWQRDIGAAIHPDPEQESDPAADELEEFTARLLGSKPGHAELIRHLHGGKEP